MEIYAPLYFKLRQYTPAIKAPFHMPGHKKGSAIPVEYKKDVFSLDLTELSVTDNLASPHGCILEARREAAKAFGASDTFFLTCGSTVGIMAMLAYTCGSGGGLIVDRNCHVSVIHAMALLDINPVFVYPAYLHGRGIPGSIRPADIERALEDNPGVRGALVTSPNYYGVCSDLRSIASLLHKKGKLLLVDEAHGAHFAFSPLLPEAAMQCGADIAVQSAHKTLPAPGQSALLHIAEGIDALKMQQMINLFHTSSPSYIIMAYTDLARALMQRDGQKLYARLKTYIDGLCKGLKDLGIDILEGGADVFRADFTRICATVSGVGATGYGLSAELEGRYGIVPEMADLNNVVFIAGPGNTKRHFIMLKKALKELARSPAGRKPPRPAPPPDSLRVMPLARAYWGGKKKIPLKESAGKVCAGIVSCYPPSVPVILPGEEICRGHIEYIEAVTASGGRVTGLEGGMVETAAEDG